MAAPSIPRMADSPTPLAGRPVAGPDTAIAIAVARFNQPVTSKLLEGALAAAAEAGIPADRVQVVEVPGAFELPMAARWLSRGTPRPTAIVCLGCVIRGDTDHYDYVCDQSAAGIMNVGLELDVPVAFGVLTCDTGEQAFARAGGAKGNKGADALNAVLEMADLKARLTPDS